MRARAAIFFSTAASFKRMALGFDDAGAADENQRTVVRKRYVAAFHRRHKSLQRPRAFLHRRGDEPREDRMRAQRTRLEFRMELDADEERMVLHLDDLGQFLRPEFSHHVQPELREAGRDSGC